MENQKKNSMRSRSTLDLRQPGLQNEHRNRSGSTQSLAIDNNRSRKPSRSNSQSNQSRQGDKSQSNQNKSNKGGQVCTLYILRNNQKALTIIFFKNFIFFLAKINQSTTTWISSAIETYANLP